MITVSNTSPLLSFAKIDRLDLLESLCQSIFIPNAVHDELMVRKERRDAQAIAQAKWIQVTPVKNQRAVHQLMRRDLDLGESEAIVLAKELNADRLLLDDLAARQIASRRKIPIVGSLGLLLLAKSLRLITAVKPFLNEMIDAG
jgi:predicted nucleic acid-binding protein